MYPSKGFSEDSHTGVGLKRNSTSYDPWSHIFPIQSFLYTAILGPRQGGFLLPIARPRLHRQLSGRVLGRPGGLKMPSTLEY